MSAAAVCRGYPLVNWYQPNNQQLPWVEDTLSFTWYQPHISGCHVQRTLLSHSFKVIWGPRGARSHLIPLRRKARKGEGSLMPLHAKVRSHLTPLHGKAREGVESPDAPVWKSARRRGVTWYSGAHPISLPDFDELLRQLFTPLQSGVQLGHIA